MIKYDYSEYNNPFTITYYVNEFKHTVTAHLHVNNPFPAISPISDRMNKCIALVCILSKSECINDLIIPTDYKATVKCHESDTFDIELGKKIARKRVLNKFYAKRYKAWESYKKKLNSEIVVLDTLMSKYPAGDNNREV